MRAIGLIGIVLGFVLARRTLAKGGAVGRREVEGGAESVILFLEFGNAVLQRLWEG